MFCCVGGIVIHSRLVVWMCRYRTIRRVDSQGRIGAKSSLLFPTSYRHSFCLYNNLISADTSHACHMPRAVSRPCRTLIRLKLSRVACDDCRQFSRHFHCFVYSSLASVCLHCIFSSLLRNTIPSKSYNSHCNGLPILNFERRKSAPS